ncbi:hypothetical protein [Crenobacter cavernae]|uniref:DUF1488 family protein n=1 Tax=Crenobacter cavernae TaxID=2290923 RepID=A0ABY0FAH2_9NEIS|nr:hypothetical protein [Crenobacter cavernae]RXZ42653.1 hypothetical protein EBB06_12215 [Crenobacter cavernae]
MLELSAARVEPDGRILIEAHLDGVSLSFHLAREAIEDHLGIKCADPAECRMQVEQNWGAFATKLERLAHAAKSGMEVSTQMLNPDS